MINTWHACCCTASWRMLTERSHFSHQGDITTIHRTENKNFVDGKFNFFGFNLHWCSDKLIWNTCDIEEYKFHDGCLYLKKWSYDVVKKANFPSILIWQYVKQDRKGAGEFLVLINASSMKNITVEIYESFEQIWNKNTTRAISCRLHWWRIT